MTNPRTLVRPDRTYLPLEGAVETLLLTAQVGNYDLPGARCDFTTVEAEDRLSLLATDQFLIALGWLPQIVSGTTPDLTANVWMLTHLIVGGDHLQFHGAGTPPTLLRYTGGDWNGGGREQFMTTEPYVVDPGLPGWFIRYDGGHGGPADGRGGVDVPYFWHNPDPTLGYERDGALYLPRLHARTVYERLSSQLFQQVAPLIVAQRGCNPA